MRRRDKMAAEIGGSADAMPWYYRVRDRLGWPILALMVLLAVATIWHG